MIIPLSLLLGAVSTGLGMIQAFGIRAAAESVEPSQLANDISTSLRIGMFAIPIAGIALGVRIWANVKLRRMTQLKGDGGLFH